MPGPWSTREERYLLKVVRSVKPIIHDMDHWKMVSDFLKNKRTAKAYKARYLLLMEKKRVNFKVKERADEGDLVILEEDEADPSKRPWTASEDNIVRNIDFSTRANGKKIYRWANAFDKLEGSRTRLDIRSRHRKLQRKEEKEEEARMKKEDDDEKRLKAQEALAHLSDLSNSDSSDNEEYDGADSFDWSAYNSQPVNQGGQGIRRRTTAAIPGRRVARSAVVARKKQPEASFPSSSSPAISSTPSPQPASALPSALEASIASTTASVKKTKQRPRFTPSSDEESPPSVLEAGASTSAASGFLAAPPFASTTTSSAFPTYAGGSSDPKGKKRAHETAFSGDDVQDLRKGMKQCFESISVLTGVVNGLVEKMDEKGWLAKGE
ncbi:hypothetical protein JCM11641_002549 [Rhodosporidiobolus odoratus]